MIRLLARGRPRLKFRDILNTCPWRKFQFRRGSEFSAIKRGLYPKMDYDISSNCSSRPEVFSQTDSIIEFLLSYGRFLPLVEYFPVSDFPRIVTKYGYFMIDKVGAARDKNTDSCPAKHDKSTKIPDLIAFI